MSDFMSLSPWILTVCDDPL